MNVQIIETTKAIREAEHAFKLNESSDLGEWTKEQRRYEISQALLLLRADLTTLVEQEIMIDAASTNQSTKQAA